MVKQSNVSQFARRDSVWNITDDEISISFWVRISTLILNSVNIKFQLVSVYGV
jgi:hypothetical protein